MKNRLMMLTVAVVVFIGVFAVVLISDNLGIRGWESYLVMGIAAVLFALLGQLLYRKMHLGRD